MLKFSSDPQHPQFSRGQFVKLSAVEYGRRYNPRDRYDSSVIPRVGSGPREVLCVTKNDVYLNVPGLEHIPFNPKALELVEKAS